MKHFSLSNVVLDPSGAFKASVEQPISKPKKQSSALKPVSIRFTAKEREFLNKARGKQSLSRYIRSALFEDLTLRQRGRPAMSDRTGIAQVLGLLGKSDLAANMQTLAKAAEMGALPVTEDVLDALREACSDIRLMRRTLISALGVKNQE